MPKEVLDPSLKMRRPPCPVCEWKTWLVQIEAGATIEKHRFMCPRSEHEEVQELPRGPGMREVA